MGCEGAGSRWLRPAPVPPVPPDGARDRSWRPQQWKEVFLGVRAARADGLRREKNFRGFCPPPPPSGEVGGQGQIRAWESRKQLRPQGSLKRRVSAEAGMPGLRSVGQEERRSRSVFSIPRSTHPPLPCLFEDGHSCLSQRICQCEEDAPRRRMAWRRISLLLYDYYYFDYHHRYFY